MGKTLRWFNKPQNISRLNGHRAGTIRPWRDTNPYYFRHELKEVRVELHRESRHANRIRVRKGQDIEPEIKTNGWNTH